MSVNSEQIHSQVEVDSKLKCKGCNKEFKKILIHIGKSKCKEAYSDEERENLKASQMEITNNQSSQRKEKEAKEICKSCNGEFKSLLTHLARTENDECKKAYSKDEKTQIKTQKRKCYEETNKDQINEKQSRYDLRNRDEKKKYYKTNKHEILHKKKENYETNKDDILHKKKARDQKKKDETSAEERLLAFRNDIKDGPTFVCLSCSRSMFKSQVKILDKDAIKKLFEKCPEDIIKRATSYRIQKITKMSRGVQNKILCRNCYTGLYNDKKIPRMSVHNGLELDQIPEELKLTDYEEQLIALNMLFIKIFPLPKSGMNKVVGRVINVPLEVEDVANTVTKLPRNFEDAKLVPVNWKRKLSSAATHIQAYVRADLLVKAVEKLKQLKNPHYINIDINQNFNIPEESLDEMPIAEKMEIEDEFVNDLVMTMETDEKNDAEEIQVENVDNVNDENIEEMPLPKDE